MHLCQTAHQQEVITHTPSGLSVGPGANHSAGLVEPGNRSISTNLPTSRRAVLPSGQWWCLFDFSHNVHSSLRDRWQSPIKLKTNLLSEIFSVTFPCNAGLSSDPICWVMRQKQFGHLRCLSPLVFFAVHCIENQMALRKSRTVVHFLGGEGMVGVLKCDQGATAGADGWNVEQTDFEGISPFS